MNSMKINLSVEESLEFAKFEARWEGFVAGARAAAEEAIRRRIAEMTAAKARVVPMEPKKEAV